MAGLPPAARELEALSERSLQVMLMLMIGVPLAEALVRLRADASAADQRLAVLAADIVARRVTLERNQGEQPGWMMRPVVQEVP